ncbi:ATP-binding protein [Candidatus Saccharibacteria bacterium]|nr:ATP-binding protein [Candidatus Saccharibacteria bacterium]
MKEQFVGREKELAWLETGYRAAHSEGQLLILYGKRRVGKTELAKHFISSKDSIYFVAEKGTPQDQLKTAKNTFADGFNDEVMRNATFESWRDLFRYIGQKLDGRKKPFVLVFDEFPYLAESDGAMSSYFQIGWDEFLKDKKVLMVLMGSSISMMYKHALLHSAPLYGRRTGQWMLEPFNYAGAKLFHGAHNAFVNTFSLYAITGGIPAYERVFRGNKTLEGNLRRFVLPEGSYLSVEPELLLSEEFTNPRPYLSILKAIGLGRTRFSEIVSETGIGSTALPGYLGTLLELRLIKKEIPVTEKVPETSKTSTYSLSDSFLRFYFSFIYPHSSLIKGGSIDALFSRHGEILQQLVAKAYEDAAKQFIEHAMQDELLPHFDKLDRWWNKNCEIDVVGVNDSEQAILFTEVKWTNQKMHSRILDGLKEKSVQVKWGTAERKEYYCLVSKSGFTDELIKKAKAEGVVLIQEDRVLAQ